MNIQEILSKVDHTQLSPVAVWADICTLCDEGIAFGMASVCIPPAYVADAASYTAGRLPVCTVIGFPNGYASTAAKCFEAQDAARRGAGEIDMVINLGWLKDGCYKKILKEIRSVKAAAGDLLLKVIIETCLLTREEKIKMCDVVSDSGAQYIKTSTGFGGSGATFEDVELFKSHIAPHVKIKAAGGISTLADAEKFLALGASRLGSSRMIKISKGEGLI